MLRNGIVNSFILVAISQAVCWGQPPSPLEGYVPAETFAGIRLSVPSDSKLLNAFASSYDWGRVKEYTYLIGASGQDSFVVMIRFADEIDESKFAAYMKEGRWREKVLEDGRRYFEQGDDCAMLVEKRLWLHAESAEAFLEVVDGKSNCPQNLRSIFAEVDGDRVAMRAAARGINTEEAALLARWHNEPGGPGDQIAEWLDLVDHAELAVSLGPEGGLQMNIEAKDGMGAKELQKKLAELLELMKSWLTPGAEVPFPVLQKFQIECCRASCDSPRLTDSGGSRDNGSHRRSETWTNKRNGSDATTVKSLGETRCDW